MKNFKLEPGEHCDASGSFGQADKKYRCPHCKKVVERRSEKKWIPSYCADTDRRVRLQLIKQKP
jgi:ribosomal protein L37AE/L43A